MAETFGEADVILRVRLDQLQQQLDQSEALVIDSTEKVARSQEQVYREAATANHEQRRGWADVAVALLHAIGIYKIATTTIGYTTIGMKALAAASTTAAVAMAAIPVALFSVATLAVGLLGDATERAGRAAQGIADAYGRLDGSTQKVRELHEELAQIPIVGGLIVRIAGLISSDQTIRTEAWMRFATTVQDGEIKVRLLARAVNGLISLAASFDPDFKSWVAEIDEANEKLREMNRLMAVQQGGRAIGMQVGGSAENAARQAARDAELAQLDGIERVRAAERHRHEDVVRSFEDQRQVANQMYSEQVAAIRKRAEEEKWGAAETERVLLAASMMQSQTLDNLETQRQAAERDTQAAAETRIRLAQQEAAEHERVNQIRRQGEEGAMRSSIAAMGAELGGDRFTAQRIDVDAMRQRAMDQLAIEGQANADRIQLVHEYYDARQRLIDQREQQQLDRDKEIQQRRDEAMLTANERLRSQILQARLTAAGEEVEARQEAIRQRFQEQIDQLYAQGNRVGADLARTLRDLQLEAAAQENEQARMQDIGRGRQVELARMAPGVDTDDRKLEREQLAALKGIERNTKPTAQVARAG